MTLAALLDAPTRVLFFTGKGGMGKTTLACATAVTLAANGRRVLLVSTDPASNLDEVLETELGDQPRSIPGAGALEAINIDPEGAAAAHREAAVAPFRGVLPDSAIASMEESLSGACTVEIAAFDAFSTLLADPAATSRYDHVVFDTAPTGHTLRLLTLPGAWTDFIDTNTSGTSCLGPLAGLQAKRDLYAAGVTALSDPSTTTLVLVSRPEPTALTEAARASTELHGSGMTHQHLVINGILTDPDLEDPTAAAYSAQQQDAVAHMPNVLQDLSHSEVPLSARTPIGVGALGDVFSPPGALASTTAATPVAERPLSTLIDGLEAPGRGVIMTMGKGGVGKTTVAATIARELAERGHRVLLTTTDPAAHVQAAAGEALPGLEVSRIDPAAVTASYRDEVLAAAGDVSAETLAVLEEDLRSPCTEEIAVFRAFAETVASGSDRFVVLDTAPTGHTLLLLDAAHTYHREVERGQGHIPESVVNLLPRMRDLEYTRVLITTLPEPTPVHEAQRLATDLRRAEIEPYAWIVNQSLAETGTHDPTLAARATAERRWVDEVLDHATRAAIISWRPVRQPTLQPA